MSNLKKTFFLSFLYLVYIIFLIRPVLADKNNFPLSGRILLQVQSHGEAWYVNPADQKRYYLGRPADAFELMKKLGIGITDNDLNKIPTSGQSFVADKNFIKNNLGKIFIQVEKQGQAWYINPVDKKRYFLNRPADAFNIMRNLGLGITDNELNKINAGYINQAITVITNPPPRASSSADNCKVDTSPQEIINIATKSIIKNNKPEATSCFIPEAKNSVSFAMGFLTADGRLALGNLLSGSRMVSSTDDEKIYSINFSFAGWNTTHEFHIKKQIDGRWLLISL
jgi:hypothetical protein